MNNFNNRTIAIGDIHGCFNSLKELIEDKIQLTKNDQLILLGDYIDRGLQSKEVIDYIIELQQNYNVIALMGNHETMLLDAYANDKYLAKWLANGGAETLDSFGIKALSELDERYISFFNNLIPYYQIDNYLFVHAGFNNDIEDPFSDTYTMLWKCRTTYLHLILNGKNVIHSHCPVKVDDCNKAIKENSSIINIDTGCVYKERAGYGVLAAYDVTNNKVYFV